MGNDYDIFVMRLKEERLRLNLSQNELSKSMKMTQNHYSKSENGIKRFTLYELQNLRKTPVDLFYIFTGEHSCIYNTFLLNNDFEQLLFCIKLINLMARWRYSENSTGYHWEKVYKQTRYIEYVDNIISQQYSIFKSTRMYMNYTQSEMANKIGIDIKKLRALEVDRLLPDSELILKMYKLFGLSPAVFLKDGRYLNSEICSLLEKVNDDVKKNLLSCIEFVYSCK